LYDEEDDDDDVDEVEWRLRCAMSGRSVDDADEHDDSDEVDEESVIGCEIRAGVSSGSEWCKLNDDDSGVVLEFGMG